MSITHAIGKFSTGTYAITRYTPGARVAGIWIEGTPTIYNADASIQPVTGQALRTLPRGQNVEDNRLILTIFALANRDRVDYKGESWEVYNVKDWNKRGVTWSQAMMTRTKLAV